MADITITITADEDDLRFVAARASSFVAVVNVSRAIVAALPKPRIVVRPGMVLRRNSDGMRFMAHVGTAGIYLMSPFPGRIDQTAVWEPAVALGLDPAEWTVVLEAD